MMNFGFGVAGIVSPLVFGYLIDVTGSWTWLFAGSVVLLPLGAALAFRMHPDRQFEHPSPERGGWPRASARGRVGWTGVGNQRSECTCIRL